MRRALCFTFLLALLALTAGVRVGAELASAQGAGKLPPYMKTKKAGWLDRLAPPGTRFLVAAPLVAGAAALYLQNNLALRYDVRQIRLGVMGLVNGVAWQQRKRDALAETASAEFWTSPRRYTVLGLAGSTARAITEAAGPTGLQLAPPVVVLKTPPAAATPGSQPPPRPLRRPR